VKLMFRRKARAEEVKRMLKELADEGTESGNWKDKTRVSFSVFLHHSSNKANARRKDNDYRMEVNQRQHQHHHYHGVIVQDTKYKI
jgi:hypothetical protein